MFWKERTPLDLEHDRAVHALKSHPVGSKEYQSVLTIVDELGKQRDKDKPSTVSKDTLAVIAGNLLGILMIIKHEHVNVITSRAFGLLLKPRV